MRRRGWLVRLMGLIIVLTLRAGGLTGNEPVPPMDTSKPAALNPEQQGRLREAKQLLKEANALLSNGKQDESQEKVDEALAIRREVLGPEHEQVEKLLRESAHVLPRYPDSWHYPSSANPQESYTLLNRESQEFVRFENPSDYLAADKACGACHNKFRLK